MEFGEQKIPPKRPADDVVGDITDLVFCKTVSLRPNGYIDPTEAVKEGQMLSKRFGEGLRADARSLDRVRFFVHEEAFERATAEEAARIEEELRAIQQRYSLGNGSDQRE